MTSTDTFLVGVDLVKDSTRLEAAYNDPDGVTVVSRPDAEVIYEQPSSLVHDDVRPRRNDLQPESGQL
jgi:hypothetical protein